MSTSSNDRPYAAAEQSLSPSLQGIGGWATGSVVPPRDSAILGPGQASSCQTRPRGPGISLPVTNASFIPSDISLRSTHRLSNGGPTAAPQWTVRSTGAPQSRADSASTTAVHNPSHLADKACQGSKQVQPVNPFLPNPPNTPTPEASAFSPLLQYLAQPATADGVIYGRLQVRLQQKVTPTGRDAVIRTLPR